jgi:ribosomal protein S20
MKLTKRHGFAVFLAVLLVGGVLFGTALARGAQTEGGPGSVDPCRAGGKTQGKGFDDFLGKLARNLGIDEPTLQRALVQTEQEIADEAVAAGRLKPEKAARIKQRVEQSGGRRFFHGRHSGPRHGPKGVVARAAAEALGVTVEQLKAELPGTTLSALAAKHNKDPEVVKQKIVDALTVRVDEGAAAGYLTPERAQTIKAQLSQRVELLMSHTFVPCEHQRPGGSPRVKAPA